MVSNVKKKRRNPDGFSAITCNSLLDGSVYWLTFEKKWDPDFSRAHPFPNAEIDSVIDQEMGKNDNKHLVGIVEEPVTKDGSGVRPTTMKGTIRAFGPKSQD